MSEKRETINIGGMDIDKEWFYGLGGSANTSLNYRKNGNSKYKIDPTHDKIGYTIRGGGNGPLQGKGDYYVRLVDDGQWEALDSSGNIIKIPDKFEYFDKNGFLQKFNNGDSIRSRALDYGNAKDRTTINGGADINTDGVNNIYYYGWDLLKDLKDKDREKLGFVAPQTISNFVYPYKDSKGNILRTDPNKSYTRSGRRLITNSPIKRRFK